MSDEREYPNIFTWRSDNLIFHKWLKENLSESELNIIAPKKKVKKKMWLWAWKDRLGYWLVTPAYWENPNPDWKEYKRLDYTEIEVEE